MEFVQEGYAAKEWLRGINDTKTDMGLWDSRASVFARRMIKLFSWRLENTKIRRHRKIPKVLTRVS